MMKHKEIEWLTFEAVKRVHNYSGVELKGRLLFNNLGLDYLGV